MPDKYCSRLQGAPIVKPELVSIIELTDQATMVLWRPVFSKV
jgi:hypothetical protein